MKRAREPIFSRGTIIGKLCASSGMGPMTDPVHWFAADKMSISLAQVELDKGNTLSGKVWIKSRFDKFPTLVKR